MQANIWVSLVFTWALCSSGNKNWKSILQLGKKNKSSPVGAARTTGNKRRREATFLLLLRRRVFFRQSVFYSASKLSSACVCFDVAAGADGRNFSRAIRAFPVISKTIPRFPLSYLAARMHAVDTFLYRCGLYGYVIGA